ncbi:serine/threonine-protein kinase [Streptomyces noursei]|uniref:serine/threonine-protein kinase n=1 Tax=Streptomyces noursei TaxID=1971 RepID=UPI00069D4925|nr:serine/threonine-protein kinase [Streptomyces noursei]
MRMLGVDGPTHVGPFRTVGVLGQGGMGQVLLGVAPDGRLVAVKRVHADLAEDPGFRSRFRREVDASRRVSGAYTAPVVDADPDASTPWLASLFLPGPTLDEALEAGGPLPEEAVRLLAAGLAQALDDIHRAGLVHRDLKPSNVLLTEDGVRVVDFGIARAADHETKLTRTGALIGSPAYMSPEQVRGEQPGPASDVFSLGVTLVTASTGRSPFAGDSPLALLHAVAHDLPDLESVPARLRPLVEPCLAKDPAARPTPAQLRALIGPLAPAARPWPRTVYERIAERRDWATRLTATAEPLSAPAPPALPIPVDTVPTPAPATPRASVLRRRPGWLLGAIVGAVALATAVATVLALGPTDVYHSFFPEPVPTPGSVPLAKVSDKYTKTVPTCAQAGRSMTAPAGFGRPGGNVPGVWQQSDGDGHSHPSTRCVWTSRSGDQIDFSWDLYRSRAGGPTGAEQSKEHYEGMYMGSKTLRDAGLGFVEEGMWLNESSENNCVLYARDVNLYLFVAVKGVHYPKGACEGLAKDMARQGVAAVKAL